MRKLLLLLITLTTLTNISYASFPVTETEQTEVVEYDSINNLPVSFIGVLVGILSCIIIPFNFFLPLFIKAFNYDSNRSFRTGFIIGAAIGAILLLIFLHWLLSDLDLSGLNLDLD